MNKGRKDVLEGDTIVIKCCSEGHKHIGYALKVLSAILVKNKGEALPMVSMNWGSECLITIHGHWHQTSIVNFLRRASSKEAINAGSWRRTVIERHHNMLNYGNPYGAEYDADEE